MKWLKLLQPFLAHIRGGRPCLRRCAEFRSRMTSGSGSGNMARPRKNIQLCRRLLLPPRASQPWLRSILLDYYVIVRVKMCDDSTPCGSCVAVSTSQVDVFDSIWRKNLIAKVSIDFTYRKYKGLLLHACVENG